MISDGNNIKVSIILLDWSVREHFQSLHFLRTQDISRHNYELIWVETFDKAPPMAHDFADRVICCGQKGVYHKHKAWNRGVLAASGGLCDSDAIFQRGFVRSIINHYINDGSAHPSPLVLMHYQARTKTEFPGMEKINLDSIEQEFNWQIWENTGACFSCRKTDFITYGGLDESNKFLGYYCGPYDLAWRLINAGIKEEWVPRNESILYHFAHPAPVCSLGGYSNIMALLEIRGGHIKGHAYWAVEAFATGRMLPLRENPEIQRLRLAKRQIGSVFEEEYSDPRIMCHTWLMKCFGKYICRYRFLYYNIRLFLSNCFRKLSGAK